MSNGVSRDDETNITSISLASDLEQKILHGFDRLVEQGEILWGPYTSETISKDGINLVFQLSPYIGKKPIQDRNDESRKTGKGKNPFLDPDPRFVISQVGPRHTLIHNKFPVYRPSLLLHTKHFVPQEEVLDADDFNAVWAVLRQLNQEYLVIYNCGFDSGSSQGHKHMQLWPYPRKTEIGFDVFPSHVNSDTEIATALPGTAIRHYALRLPADATATDVHATYRRLLVEVNKCHQQYGSTSHNVALIKNWLCLIPRRSNGLDKGAGANAAAALGTIWLSSEDEKEIWTTPTVATHYCHIGVPLDQYSSRNERGPEENLDLMTATL